MKLLIEELEAFQAKAKDTYFDEPTVKKCIAIVRQHESERELDDSTQAAVARALCKWRNGKRSLIGFRELPIAEQRAYLSQANDAIAAYESIERQPEPEQEIVKQQENTMLTDEQIKHMRDRFLGWKIPVDKFFPDCGIRFNKDEAKQWNPNNATYEPYGTNLFDAQMAEQMIRYMLDGLPMNTDIEADKP